MGRHNITVATYVTRTPVDQERKEIEGSLSNIDHVLLGNGRASIMIVGLNISVHELISH